MMFQISSFKFQIKDMATITEFEDLKIWQQARKLAKDIHSTAMGGPFAKDYGLRDQINRSSGSVMDNTAEGFTRHEV